MNSTESNADVWADQDQFVTDFLAIADTIRADAGDLFPLAADPTLDTYYRDRRKTRMAPVDFEVDGLASPADLEAALRSMWQGQGIATLASFAPRLAEAALELHKVEAENNDVSPLIYAMF